MILENAVKMILEGLIKSGAPWGILCAALMYTAIHLWRRCVVLSDKLFELGMAQVKTSTEVHKTLETVKDDLEAIRRLNK